MSGINEFDLRGAQADVICLLPATGANFVYADLGKPVTLVNDAGVAKFGRGADNDRVYGKIQSINAVKNDFKSGTNIAGANDDISVQNKGFAEFGYTGAAPTVGASIAISATAGLVKAAALSITAPHIVVKVDTTNTKVVVELK
jgi:hypothetical protein